MAVPITNPVTCGGDERPVRVVFPRSPLAALVSRPAVGVTAETTVADAVALMRRESVSALLVDGDAGIVTERDLARALGAGRTAADPVGSVATPKPLTVPGTMTVVTAAGLMLNEQLRHLVVHIDATTSGIVSMRDILAVLLQVADPHLWLRSLRAVMEAPAELWLG